MWGSLHSCSFRQETVLTSHHHCSGDLIHRAVFSGRWSWNMHKRLLYFWSLASEEIHNTWLSSKASTNAVDHIPREKNKNMQSYVVNYHHICSGLITFGFLSVVLLVYAAVEMHLKE